MGRQYLRAITGLARALTANGSNLVPLEKSAAMCSSAGSVRTTKTGDDYGDENESDCETVFGSGDVLVRGNVSRGEGAGRLQPRDRFYTVQNVRVPRRNGPVSDAAVKSGLNQRPRASLGDARADGQRIAGSQAWRKSGYGRALLGHQLEGRGCVAGYQPCRVRAVHRVLLGILVHHHQRNDQARRHVTRRFD